MGGAKRSSWIGGAVFIGLIMLAATYFLAVSPTLATASETRTEVNSTNESNIALQAKIDQLAVDFAKLDDYKAQLAAIRTQIPTTADLSGYLRQLDTIAVARSVTLTAVNPAVAQTVVSAVAAPAAPAAKPAAEAPSSTEAGATDAVAPAAPAANAAPAGFAAILFSINVVGTYDNTLAFINDLQNATPRLFLVSGLTATPQGHSDAGGGRPATAIGDVELAVTGYTYVLTDPSVVPAAADPAAPAVTLPGAVAGKNPLIPLGGK